LDTLTSDGRGLQFEESVLIVGDLADFRKELILDALACFGGLVVGDGAQRKGALRLGNGVQNTDPGSA